MFARKILTDSHLRRIVNCQVIRTIRGKIRIPVQLTETKRKSKQIPRNHLDEIRESNIGIGHSLAAQMEYYGKYMEDDVDLDEIEKDIQNDLGLDDIQPKIRNLSALVVSLFVFTVLTAIYNILKIFDQISSELEKGLSKKLFRKKVLSLFSLVYTSNNYVSKKCV